MILCIITSASKRKEQRKTKNKNEKIKNGKHRIELRCICLVSWRSCEKRQKKILKSYHVLNVNPEKNQKQKTKEMKSSSAKINLATNHTYLL